MSPTKNEEIVIKNNRKVEIGLKLIMEGYVDTKDIKYIKDHCLKEKGWSDLTEDEKIALEPRDLTQGQKSYRTWLINTRKHMDEARDMLK